MQRVIRLIFLMVLLSAITQSVQSQEGIGSGRGTNYKTAPTKTVLTAEQIAQRFLPGVALIICDDGKENYSQGSGFFIAPGMILTNAHVVKGMVRGVVIAGGQQKKNLISEVAYFNSENTDLALLVSDEAKKVKTPILPLAQPNDLSIGETIYVLSNPKGLSGTISQGIVSSEIRKMKNMELLQITAPISEGSSGGAVMNSRGEVIGIATSSLQSGQNLNFAVPSTQIRLFIDKFLAESKNLEYISASNLPNSWMTPKSFLSQSENGADKRMLPSDPNNSQPSFEETTQWLTNKLVGRSVDLAKGINNKPNHIFKTERIVFNRCNMYLEQQNFAGKWTYVYAYRINMNSVKEILIITNEQDAISIKLNDKIPAVTKGYASNDMSNPYDTYTYTDDLFFLGTDNRESSERIEKAFNFIVTLCRENVKEPF